MRYTIEFTDVSPNGIAVHDSVTDETKHYDLVRIPHGAVVRQNLLGRRFIATESQPVGSHVRPPQEDAAA